MNLPVITETVPTSTMSVMVFGTAEMVLMNEIALQDAVMTTRFMVFLTYTYYNFCLYPRFLMIFAMILYTRSP